MVCYHTPKPISLDIFKLLTTTNQSLKHTNKHIRFRHSQPHAQTNTNKQIRHSQPHCQPHCSLPITVLSRYQAQRFKGTSLSLSFIFFLFKHFFFFYSFWNPDLNLLLFLFLSFFSPHSETHDTVTTPLSSFVFFSFLKPVPFSLCPHFETHDTVTQLLCFFFFFFFFFLLKLVTFFSLINEARSSSLS